MYLGTYLVLVPNDEYKTTTVDPHMTLAQFGDFADLDEWQLKLIRRVASDIAENLDKPYWTKRPRSNGRITFNVDPEQNNGNRFCYADVAEHNALPRARGLVEERLGFSLNRTFGFVPHITIAYSDFFIPDLAKPSPMQVFDWKSVEIWMGEDREVFPIDRVDDDAQND